MISTQKATGDKKPFAVWSSAMRGEMGRVPCDAETCPRSAVGMWQSDAHLCEKHANVAIAYWDNPKRPQ